MHFYFVPAFFRSFLLSKYTNQTFFRVFCLTADFLCWILRIFYCGHDLKSLFFTVESRKYTIISGFFHGQAHFVLKKILHRICAVSAHLMDKRPDCPGSLLITGLLILILLYIDVCYVYSRLILKAVPIGEHHFST